MASPVQNLHFVLIPMVSQSQLIPTMDFGKLLARQGVIVSIITTPVNASRFQASIDRAAASSNLQLQILTVPFPCREAGLPDGCENIDTLTSPDMVRKFFMATYMLQGPMEKLVTSLEPRASCIITSTALPWLTKVALRLELPRYLINYTSTFAIACNHCISYSGVDDSATSDTDPFVVPGVPDRVEMTRAQLPDVVSKKESNDMKGIIDQIKEAEISANGILVNSFDEIESAYADVFRKLVKKVWCIGPVSFCNKDVSDKLDRGNKNSIDEHYCLKWLDSMEPGSVLYACFGSLCRIPPPQLIELASGLEASNRPFVWVIRKEDCLEEIEEWLVEENYEERIKGKGLLIRGWAPQILILSHPAIGGFLTHAGWNSVTESLGVGLPLITWPMLAEQFFNERFVLDVMKIGVGIGVKVTAKWAKEHNLGVLVKREDVKEAVEQLMGEGEEAEQRRKRARKLSELAKRATEEGGSSHLNLTLFVQDVMREVIRRASAQESGMSQGPCSPLDRSAAFQAMFKSGKAAS